MGMGSGDLKQSLLVPTEPREKVLKSTGLGRPFAQRVQSPAPRKWVKVTHTCNPNTWVMETEGSEVQGQPGLLETVENKEKQWSQKFKAHT